MNKFLTSHYNDFRAANKNTRRYMTRAAILHANMGKGDVYHLGGDLGWATPDGSFRTYNAHGGNISLMIARMIGMHTHTRTIEQRKDFIKCLHDIRRLEGEGK